MIVLYCFLLAVTFNESIHDEYIIKTAMIAEKILSIIFLVEVWLRIIGMGFAYNPHAYMRDSINILDFFFGLSVVVNLILELFNVKASLFRSMKVFRALRPLRMARAESLRNTIGSLGIALPKIA